MSIDTSTGVFHVLQVTNYSSAGMPTKNWPLSFIRAPGKRVASPTAADGRVSQDGCLPSPFGTIREKEFYDLLESDTQVCFLLADI
ncbi:uncharacterized protein ARMOST_16010 [Armillaria ostoyae]|uniref:Uncharacterized protein n=1 Tax=Armillaria ostoyae TaxID=47428 RepID=A0A284RV04_ARMOS|nr:uncharacterized protein ARMOST_16010 [Armillaria ostoyae]